MTEYELNNLAQGSMSNFLATFTIFVSIVTAYVVAAFIVGRRLSAVQLWIVNVSFLISTSVIGSLSYLIFSMFVLRVQLAQELSVAEHGTLVDYRWIVAVLYVLLTVGCLVFMWNTRKATARVDRTE